MLFFAQTNLICAKNSLKQAFLTEKVINNPIISI